MQTTNNKITMIKNLGKLILVSLIMATCQIAQAQDNVAKIGLIGLATKTINLKYERVLNENASANLNLTFRIPGGLPFGLDLQEIIDTEITGDVKLNGFSIAPEYRIYTRGDAPRGFYFAPYLQYGSNSIKYDGIVDRYATNTKLAYNNFGAGIQLGVQWLIQDKVSIDWTFLGLGIGRHGVKARYESDDQGIDFQNIIANIESDLADIPVIGDRFEFEAGADYAEGKVRAVLPLFRGGLTIGYAF